MGEPPTVVRKKTKTESSARDFFLKKHVPSDTFLRDVLADISTDTSDETFNAALNEFKKPLLMQEQKQLKIASEAQNPSSNARYGASSKFRKSLDKLLARTDQQNGVIHHSDKASSSRKNTGSSETSSDEVSALLQMVDQVQAEGKRGPRGPLFVRPPTQYPKPKARAKNLPKPRYTSTPMHKGGPFDDNGTVLSPIASVRKELLFDKTSDREGDHMSVAKEKELTEKTEKKKTPQHKSIHVSPSEDQAGPSSSFSASGDVEDSPMDLSQAFDVVYEALFSAKCKSGKKSLRPRRTMQVMQDCVENTNLKKKNNHTSMSNRTARKRVQVVYKVLKNQSIQTSLKQFEARNSQRLSDIKKVFAPLPISNTIAVSDDVNEGSRKFTRRSDRQIVPSGSIVREQGALTRNRSLQKSVNELATTTENIERDEGTFKSPQAANTVADTRPERRKSPVEVADKNTSARKTRSCEKKANKPCTMRDISTDTDLLNGIQPLGDVPKEITVTNEVTEEAVGKKTQLKSPKMVACEPHVDKIAVTDVLEESGNVLHSRGSTRSRNTSKESNCSANASDVNKRVLRKRSNNTKKGKETNEKSVQPSSMLPQEGNGDSPSTQTASTSATTLAKTARKEPSHQNTSANGRHVVTELNQNSVTNESLPQNLTLENVKKEKQKKNGENVPPLTPEKSPETRKRPLEGADEGSAKHKKVGKKNRSVNSGVVLPERKPELHGSNETCAPSLETEVGGSLIESGNCHPNTGTESMSVRKDGTEIAVTNGVHEQNRVLLNSSPFVRMERLDDADEGSAKHKKVGKKNRSVNSGVVLPGRKPELHGSNETCAPSLETEVGGSLTESGNCHRNTETESMSVRKGGTEIAVTNGVREQYRVLLNSSPFVRVERLAEVSFKADRVPPEAEGDGSRHASPNGLEGVQELNKNTRNGKKAVRRKKISKDIERVTCQVEKPEGVRRSSRTRKCRVGHNFGVVVVNRRFGKMFEARSMEEATALLRNSSYNTHNSLKRTTAMDVPDSKPKKSVLAKSRGTSKHSDDLLEDIQEDNNNENSTLTRSGRKDTTVMDAFKPKKSVPTKIRGASKHSDDLLEDIQEDNNNENFTSTRSGREDDSVERIDVNVDTRGTVFCLKPSEVKDFFINGRRTTHMVVLKGDAEIVQKSGCFKALAWTIHNLQPGDTCKIKNLGKKGNLAIMLVECL